MIDFSNNDLEIMKELRLEGFSYQDIANKFDVNKNSVRKVLFKKYGNPITPDMRYPNHPNYTGKKATTRMHIRHMNAVIELSEAGNSNGQVSELLNVPLTIVISIVEKFLGKQVAVNSSKYRKGKVNVKCGDGTYSTITHFQKNHMTQILSLYAKDLNIKAISDIVGCSPCTVRVVLLKTTDYNKKRKIKLSKKHTPTSSEIFRAKILRSGGLIA